VGDLGSRRFSGRRGSRRRRQAVSAGRNRYAWSVLGAAAQATDRIPLMTYVTCPIRRYHPAVVAQKAATMQLLSDWRFTLGSARAKT
jgi:alkanesulfonate monooxygenase SsuD/methylene tetrahydromethanopterin reductase-like flavin-dependent oxidoreductase (luciferase family)